MRFIFYLLLINIFLNNLIVNGAFQSSIFRETNLGNEGKNLIISPLSIFQVLGLTTNGGVGTTQSEMISTLETSSLDEINNINLKLMKFIKEFVSVEIANGVMSTFWPIKSFQKVCDKYEAPIEPLFSKNQVNDWCSKQTHGKIKEIIDELDPLTVMLLLNAVYFRGEWTYPFNPKLTYSGVFYNYGKEEKKVEMMKQNHRFMYYQDEEIQAIELPYKNDSMSAVIILPNKDVDINNYVNLLNVNDEFIYNILEQMTGKVVQLNLPKFEVGFYAQLKEVLIRLGMVKPFERDADFSGINEIGGIYIDDVIHKTYLKVDEIGSEAAGITIVDIRTNSTTIPNIKMNINRPFIMIIKSKELPENNDFLFMAKIEEI